MFLFKKFNLLAFVFLYLACIVFLIKITDYIQFDKQAVLFSTETLSQLKEVNNKYQATILPPLFRNKINNQLQASLLSANLINEKDQEKNIKADVLLKFNSSDIWSGIVPVKLADKSLLNSYLQDIKKITEISYAEENIKLILNSDNLENNEVEKQAYLNFRHKFDKLKQVNKTIKVAVFDTGIDLKNEILMSQILNNDQEILNGQDDDNNDYIDDIQGWNFIDNNNDISDLNGHGSHISGVLTFNPRVKLLPLKVLGANGESDLQSLLQAFAYIKDKDIDIINLSLGTNIASNLLEEVINTIETEKKVIIVAAAGNQNVTDPYYPAFFDQVIAVCAMDKSNKKRYKNSNYGNWVDYCYRGEDLYNFDINNNFTYKSGTSQSSAHLTFFISIYMLFNNDYEINNIEQFLNTLISKAVFSKEEIGKVIDLDKLLSYIETNTEKINTISFKAISRPVKTIKIRSVPKLDQSKNSNNIGDISFFVDLKDPELKNTVLKLADKGIFKKSNNFFPENSITRAEMIKILVQITHQENRGKELWQQGKNKNYNYAVFKDVSMEDWFASYLFVAKEMNIINDSVDGFFHGEKPVVRAEAIKMILTALNIQVFPRNFIYTDVKTEDWFKNYLDYAYEHKIIELSNNYFYPANFVTRAEMAKWLDKIYLANL